MDKTIDIIGIGVFNIRERHKSVADAIEHAECGDYIILPGGKYTMDEPIGDVLLVQPIGQKDA